jgi:hypothetical protein
MKDYTMKISNIFVLKEGRTVFTGNLDHSVGYIKAGAAEVWIGEEVRAKIAVEDEMIPLNRKTKSERSVSTLDKLSDDLLAVPPELITLRFQAVGN